MVHCLPDERGISTDQTEIKMKTITWITNSGREATVSITIDKNIKYINDGWGNEIEKESPASKWTIRYSAKVDGHGEVNGLNTSISTENLPSGFAGRLGKLCFDADRRAQIEKLIEEVKSSDDWKKHLEADAAIEKAEREYYERAAKINRAMGE
jgi:hypothetical protein